MKMTRRILAVLLILVMVFGTLPMTAMAASRPEGITPDAASKMGHGVPTQIQLDNDRIVRVIVELKTAPLGKAAADLSRGTAVGADYTRALAQQRNLITEQNAAYHSLKKTYGLGKMNRRYTAIMNGFATEVAVGGIAALKADSQVMNVYIVRQYDLPTTPEGDFSSNAIVGSDIVNQHLYDGEGMLISIIDTGIDYGHELFSSLAVDHPKIENQAALNSILADANLNAAGGGYKNSKVVFGYDYADNDPDPLDTIGHGTHVAGIAAANNSAEGAVIGVAPNAQVMAMKVFSDTGGAYDDDILAAIDDSVKLGADAINMSLGSPAGFSEPEDTGLALSYGNVFQAALAAGTFLSMSAGNEAYMGIENIQDMVYGLVPYPYASNPDYGLVGATGTYTGAFSTASADNTALISHAFDATPAGGEKLVGIIYTDTNPTAFGETFDGQTLDYVAVPGYGAAGDFAGLNLTGKVALMRRGNNINFAVKVANAAAAGAIAAVVYNNEAGLDINMALEDSIPAIFIDKEGGDILAAAGTGTMHFSKDYLGAGPVATSLEISSFSSRGVTPDLKIKPELTAPGGYIYSTVPRSLGNYNSMSGTSMAAPHVTGGAALIKQRVMEDFPEITGTAQIALIKQLLMSTAWPTSGPYGSLYSVNAQGAGMMDLLGAAITPAVLIGTDNLSKVELGDKLDIDGIDVTFAIKNLSTAPVTYDLEGVLLTDAHMGMKDYLLSEFEVVIPNEYVDPDNTILLDSAPVFTGTGVANASVTVAAGSSVDVTATFVIEEEDHDDLLKYFTNGYFADGYVFAIPEGGYEENKYELSIPFLGFVGDWLQAPAFDSSNVYDTYWDPDGIYENGTYDTFYGYNAAYGLKEYVMAEGIMDLLGYNPYLINNPEYRWTDGFMPKETIAFSPGASSLGYTHFAPVIAFLRNLKSVRVEITDAENTVVRSMTAGTEYFYKSLYYSNAEELLLWNMMELGLGWDGTDNDGDIVAEGVYTYTVYGTLDYAGADDTKQSWSIDVIVDKTPPVYKSEVDSLNNRVAITAEDAMLYSITFRDGTSELARNILPPVGFYNEDSATVSLDLAPILKDYDDFEDAINSVIVEVVDYAGNIARGTLAQFMGQPSIETYYALQTVFAPGPQDKPVDIYVHALNALTTPLVARIEIFDDPWGFGSPYWDVYFIERGWEGVYDESRIVDNGDKTGSLHVPEYQFASILSDSLRVTQGMNQVNFPLTWKADLTRSLAWVASPWMPDYFYWETVTEAYALEYDGPGMPVEPGTNYRIVLQVQGLTNTAVHIPITVTNLPFIGEVINYFDVNSGSDLVFTVGFGVGDPADDLDAVTLHGVALTEGEDYVLNGTKLTIFHDVVYGLFAGNDGEDLTLSVTFNDEAGTVATSTVKTTGFTVVFDSNGGTPVDSIFGLHPNSTIAAPDVTMEKEGYLFDGWFKDEACTELWDFDSDTVTRNITLYAGWTVRQYITMGDIRTDATSDVKLPLAYILSLADMKGVMNVRITFEVDGNMLASAGMEVLSSAFTALDPESGVIRWTEKEDNIWQGELLLLFLGGEAGFTSEEALDVVKLIFTAKQLGSATVTLTGLLVTGLDEDFNGITLASEIRTAEATTDVIRVYSKYDLNKDGVVDERDLAMAQRFYQAKVSDASWEAAKACDFNNDGVVDMLDLVDLFLHFGEQ